MCVLGCVLVPIGTVGDGQRPPTGVLLVGDRLQMVGIAARFVTAEVVQLESFWNLSVSDLVGDAVKRLALPMKRDARVPVGGTWACPFPAPAFGYADSTGESVWKIKHSRSPLRVSWLLATER